MKRKLKNTETKLKQKKAVENETESEKYFTTEITLVSPIVRCIVKCKHY